MREGANVDDLGAASEQAVPTVAPQPFEVVNASNDAVVEDTMDAEPIGLQALGYAPEIEAPHGFAEPPPTGPSPFSSEPPVLTEVLSLPTVDVNLELPAKLDRS